MIWIVALLSLPLVAMLAVRWNIKSNKRIDGLAAKALKARYEKGLQNTTHAKMRRHAEAKAAPRGKPRKRRRSGQ